MSEEVDVEVGSIAKHFGKAKDPQVERSKRHKLLDIMLIAISGVTCGADNWVDLEMFGNAKLEVVENISCAVQRHSILISFSIRFGVFLAFWIYFLLAGSSFTPTLWVLFLPVLLILMAGMDLGFGIIVSSLTTKYRNLQQLVGEVIFNHVEATFMDTV